MWKIIVAAMLTLAVAGEAASTPSRPGQIAFEVLRNGEPFGRHEVEVTRNGDAFVVRTNVDLRVAAGPVTLFRYEHACVETWRQQALSALECRTLKGGRRYQVEALRGPGGLQVSGANGSSLLPANLRPTSWWLRPEEGADYLLDTETGDRMPITITSLGRETLMIGGRRIEAERMRVRGSVTVDLWYDQEGRWIGCAFEIRGQQIEYRLTTPLAAGPA